MFGWFKTREGKSKEALRDRLELVLAYDRAKVSPGKINALRNDLLEVVKKHFPGGESSVEVEQMGDKMVLSANIPLSDGTRPGPQANAEASTSASAAGKQTPLGRNSAGGGKG